MFYVQFNGDRQTMDEKKLKALRLITKPETSLISTAFYEYI